MFEKEKLRGEAKILRDKIPPAQRRELSFKIAQQTATLPWFKESQQLLLYLSIRSEVETKPLIELAWQGGKQVFAPRVNGSSRTMSFYRVDPNDAMSSGAYGIPEPTPRASHQADLSRPGLVVCPCLAFDRRGGRIGYGAGFFDRFLSGPAQGWKKAAVGFAAQEVEAVPAEDHDSRMHAIVTEKEIIYCPFSPGSTI